MADKSKISSLKAKSKMMKPTSSAEQAIKGNKAKKSDIDIPKRMGDKKTKLKAKSMM